MAKVEAKPAELNTGNRPGESPFLLKYEPQGELVFKGKEGALQPVSVDLKITNTTKDPYAFKVRCTDNGIFRVRPPLGLVKPDESITVKLIYHGEGKKMPPKDRHFFAIQHVKAKDDKKEPKEVFKGAKPDGVARIKAQFEPETAESSAPPKAEEEKKLGGASPAAPAAPAAPATPEKAEVKK